MMIEVGVHLCTSFWCQPYSWIWFDAAFLCCESRMFYALWL